MEGDNWLKQIRQEDAAKKAYESEGDTEHVEFYRTWLAEVGHGRDSIPFDAASHVKVFPNGEFSVDQLVSTLGGCSVDELGGRMLDYACKANLSEEQITEGVDLWFKTYYGDRVMSQTVDAHTKLCSFLAVDCAPLEANKEYENGLTDYLRSAIGSK